MKAVDKLLQKCEIVLINIFAVSCNCREVICYVKVIFIISQYYKHVARKLTRCQYDWWAFKHDDVNYYRMTVR